MTALSMLIIIVVAIIVMIILISKLKLSPFLVMIIVAIGVGFAAGLNVTELIDTIKTGFGNIMASIGIVIIAGTIIGTILEKTGAALQMATTILKWVGQKNSTLAMGIMGYITGVPVFCDSGFVILSPIAKALSKQSNVPMASLAVALSGGLYATHCLVPPTPGPLAMAGTLGADLGLVIGLGLLVSIVPLAIALLYAKFIGPKVPIEVYEENLETMDKLLAKYGKLPSALHSFLPLILPIILIALKSIVSLPSRPIGTGFLFQIISFIGDPVVALIIGVFVAMTLIPRSDLMNQQSAWVNQGILDSALILAITGAGGSLGAMLQKMPIAEVFGEKLIGLGVGIFIPFLIAMIMKTAMGASTVAMIATSAMMAPMLNTLGFAHGAGPALVLFAISAGSMTVSHANDSYFWVVTQFSGMNVSQGYKTQTVLTLLQGILTIVAVWLLSLILL